MDNFSPDPPSDEPPDPPDTTEFLGHTYIRRDRFRNHYLLEGHECTKIAEIRGVSTLNDPDNPREWWVGRIDEPPDWEHEHVEWGEEAYCLHIHTAVKEVVFALDGVGGDALIFATVAAMINGQPDEYPKPVSEKAVEAGIFSTVECGTENPLWETSD